MKELKIAFSNPECGWIKISVSDGCNTLTPEVDSKWNSFSALTTALLGLTEKRGEWTVFWIEEPDITVWKFANAEGKVIFESRREPYGKPLPVEPAFRFSGSYAEVCFPFWSALQSLKSRFSTSELEGRSEDEFPFTELEALTVKVETMKSQN